MSLRTWILAAREALTAGTVAKRRVLRVTAAYSVAEYGLLVFIISNSRCDS
jgi:hypothetical protein